jgi:hypothetical protein
MVAPFTSLCLRNKYKKRVRTGEERLHRRTS